MSSIADALSDPCMQHAELLGGQRGLYRPLRWVHAAEVLNIASLLEGGELLLSTGVLLAKETEQAQFDFLQSLAEKNISALAIEFGTAFDALPTCYPRWAERHAIPLVVFRREVRFSHIAHQLAQRIFACDHAQALASASAVRPSSEENDYAWACDRLDPLLRLPDKKRSRLLDTLYVLLQVHFNMSKAARILGLRRQSLYYRYTQLQDLIGDLSIDPELDGRLFLALKVWKQHAFFDTVSVESPVMADLDCKHDLLRQHSMPQVTA